jgi:hypothetical protein
MSYESDTNESDLNKVRYRMEGVKCEGVGGVFVFL